MYCQCGCGQLTRLATKSHVRYGYQVGEPLRFNHGHNGNLRKIPDSNLVKFCECGCGQPTKLARQSSTKNGNIKGQPQRFILGHKVPVTWIDTRGYRMAHVDGKDIRYSHVVAERKLGRPLQPSEEVHHINGVRADDRPENLAVITHAEHMRIHHKGKPLSAEHRAALSRGQQRRWARRRMQ